MIPLIAPGIVGLATAGTSVMGMANVIKYLNMAYTAWSAIPSKHRETMIDAVFSKGYEKAEEWTSATPSETEFDFEDETPVTFNYSIELDK